MLAACDPHGERVWEEASEADENKILISRSYKPGSVRDLLSQTPLPVLRLSFSQIPICLIH
jgi:hypothetical protein